MNADSQEVISSLRETAVNLFKAGVFAADPYLAVKRCLLIQDNALKIRQQDEKMPLRVGRWSKIHLIAFGKAACPMMQAALDVISPCCPVGQALAVTNYENAQTLSGVEVIAAGHPLPDEVGLAAAKKCAEIAQQVKSGELLLVLVSGGGSALIPYPVESVSLSDKIRTTELLLASGATINEINCVRKHLSRLKGGGLARLTAPAELHALILSDVLGDDVSAIASGSTVPDETTFYDAVNILKSKSIWQHIPDNVQNYLEKGLQGKQPETPKAGESFFEKTGYTLIGSNRISLEATTQAAQDYGFETSFI